MEVLEFYEVLSRSQGITISHKDKGLNFETMKTLKGITNYVDYQCGFNGKTCKYHRGKECCCSGCKHNIGYLENIDFGDLKVYAKSFDKVTGFWRETGCVLPRELRSHVCLRMTCREKNPISYTTLFAILRQGDPVFSNYMLFTGTNEHTAIALLTKQVKAGEWWTSLKDYQKPFFPLPLEGNKLSTKRVAQ